MNHVAVPVISGGGGHWLVRMEWCPAGFSVCLPLLISPCTIKSRSFLLAPAHPHVPEKGRKTVVVVIITFSYNSCDAISDLTLLARHQKDHMASKTLSHEMLAWLSI